MRLSMFFAALSCATCVAQSTDPDRLMQALGERRMAEQMQRLDTDERIRMYEALVKYRPEEWHYQNLLAHSFIQKMRETTDPGYLDRAARILAGVLSSDPSDYEARRLRTEVELERHNFSKVVDYSEENIRISGTDPYNFGTLGDALMELGEYDRAAAAYQRMVSLRPDLSSYNRAAYYRFVAGDPKGAIEIMKKAIQSGSPAAENTAWCIVELGNLYFKTGNPAEAEKAFSAALRTFPKYHPAHAGLGKVYAATGRGEAAIAEFQRARSITPLPDYSAALADLYAKAGKMKEAEAAMALVEIVDRMEQAAGIKTNRALALIYADHDRKLDRALDLAREELKVRRDVYTYDVLAWVLYKNKQYAEAEAAIDNALRMGTPEAQFYYHAALIAKALGKAEESKKQLERAAAINPNFETGERTQKASS